MSGDSDFFIFGTELIIYNLPSVSFSFIKVNGKRAIFCKMFCTDRFLKEYGSLPRSHSPLVGILLGTDYVHLESSQKLWSEKVVSKGKEIMDTHRRIKKVTSRLRGQTIKSALEEVWVFLFLSRDTNENFFPTER